MSARQARALVRAGARVRMAEKDQYGKLRSGGGLERETPTGLAREQGDDVSAAAVLGLPDDRILGEISHEVGNYFHKLYYWTDYLKAHDEGPAADGTAVEMLESTVERLERFVRMMLEYFAPARMSFNHVAASDIVSGLSDKLPGRVVRVEGGESWRDKTILADPSLIAHAVRTVFDRIAETLLGDDALVVHVRRSRRREFEGLEIEFRAGSGVGERARLKQGIEMAVAEKFLVMHGGELFERGAPENALVIFLPLYQ